MARINRCGQHIPNGGTMRLLISRLGLFFGLHVAVIGAALTIAGF